jgi:hypothetical protein
MNNEYLKRGKGKHTADIKKYDFFSHYRKNTAYEKLSRTAYSAFLKDLLIAFSEAVVKENMELKLGKLGFIRVQAKKLHFFKTNGEKADSLKVDWEKTWKYWEEKYPSLSRNEISNIKDKKVIYHENEHTNGEFYRHLWDKATSQVKYKSFYKFIPSRQYSRLIKEIVSKPNRTIFYYA